MELRADVVVVGGGAAGMYAAIQAKRRGAHVLLLDKSKVGRGGATVMAQMTVAAAVGHEEPDDPQLHLEDTLRGGRGINHEGLAQLLCFEAPDRILETWSWGVNWASRDGRLLQVSAPGHSRKRCCYVDVLATGIGVSNGLQKELRRQAVRHLSNVFVVDVVRDGQGCVAGVVGFDVERGEPVTVWAPAVVLAAGGLTEMYARTSASVNMTGDGYAMALRAGAELVDMEMVQFFPIAHLWPRLIGLDPIMWDPFRYKLGGRLLNGLGEEFVHKYMGVVEGGRYVAPRDVLTYAILREVAEGRGSPHGGVWLDFRGIPLDRIRAAFPPVVDKLLAQGVDLSRQPVEVAPMAHYMIGGIRTDTDMATGVPGLFAAGEAVGGAHGANRLSGNAITEAFTFGHRAGDRAAAYARQHGGGEPDAAARAWAETRLAEVMRLPGRNPDSPVTLPALRRRLQQLMWDRVGPFRTEEGLRRALQELEELEGELLPAARIGASRRYNLEWVEYLEIENMVLVGKAVALAALERRESRGAHQREDYPETLPEYERNGVVWLEGGRLRHRWEAVVRLPGRAAPVGEGRDGA